MICQFDGFTPSWERKKDQRHSRVGWDLSFYDVNNIPGLFDNYKIRPVNQPRHHRQTGLFFLTLRRLYTIKFSLKKEIFININVHA